MTCAFQERIGVKGRPHLLACPTYLLASVAVGEALAVRLVTLTRS